MLEKLMLWK